MNPNKLIVEYTDYRKFLRDYYASRKKAMSRFSYRLMAEAAGFSSASFVRAVMEGGKNLTKESAAKFSRALRLNRKSSEYFEHIVFFSQTSDLWTKEFHLKKINSFRKCNKPDLLLPKEYDYLRNWLHAVVREVVEFSDTLDDLEKLAGQFLFPVHPGDIRKSLQFLLDNGFLVRGSDGRLVKREKTIGTVDIPRDEELVTIAKKYHLQILEMAGKALLEQPREDRSISSSVLSFSKNGFELAKKRVDSLRYELLELAASDTDVDRVCQLNINLFPMIKKNNE